MDDPNAWIVRWKQNEQALHEREIVIRPFRQLGFLRSKRVQFSETLSNLQLQFFPTGRKRIPRWHLSQHIEQFRDLLVLQFFGRLEVGLTDLTQITLHGDGCSQGAYDRGSNEFGIKDDAVAPIPEV